jgi:diacylglycerol diphosphate phosphatase/phosphatidate phosphatase
LKNAIGKPRPDLIDRCQPRAESQDPQPFGLSDISICTQTNNHILKDGFRSFPSGHSATSFAGLFYFATFASAKLHVFDNQHNVWKVFFVLIPILGASLITGSRIMDARHHPFDVLAGATIGLVVALLSYRQYFPSPMDSRKRGRAYPMRMREDEPVREERPGDEEEAGDEAEYEGPHQYTVPQAQNDDEVLQAGPSSGPYGGTIQTDNVFREELSRNQHLRDQTSKDLNPSSGDEPVMAGIPTIVTSPAEGGISRPPIGSRQMSWEALSGPTTDDEAGKKAKQGLEFKAEASVVRGQETAVV